MLPFMRNKVKAQTGIMIKEREPDSPVEESNDPDAPLEACANDLIDAVHAKDVKKVAQVLKDAFELLESMPHDEAEHIEDVP